MGGSCEPAGVQGQQILTNDLLRSTVHALNVESERVTAPMQRIERTRHPWVLIGPMPLFALARDRVTLGVILGLEIDRQVWIMLFAWRASRLGLASLPPKVSYTDFGLTVVR